jgi:tRNA threonylcarbamoyladenosine biosynthesis protein TsaE
MKIFSKSAMVDLGRQLGSKLAGGEVIELVGDVGVGKTTLVKGLAAGLGIIGDVQSPSFTINRTYQTPAGLMLSHYDFYRLSDAGIMKLDIAESIADETSITVIEWAASVSEVLPSDRLIINIKYLPKDGRSVEFICPSGSKSRFQPIIDGLSKSTKIC